MISRDGHWRVREIGRDGRRLVRVEHDSPMGIPLHGGNSVGTGNGWYLAGEVMNDRDVERWVPLAELTEEDLK